MARLCVLMGIIMASTAIVNSQGDNDTCLVNCHSECAIGNPYLLQVSDNNGRISWSDAYSRCSNGLAKITTPEQLQFAQSLCPKKNCWIGLAQGYELASIGISFDGNEKGYYWYDGEPFDTSNFTESPWANGEPSNSDNNAYENCVALTGSKHSKMNDEHCNGDSYDKSYDIRYYLCNNPDYYDDCDICNCGICTISGDPHIFTFDNLLFHFMGECSYYYVTSCMGDRSINSGIPFEISGEHYNCALTEGATCVKAVYITFYDENGNEGQTVRLGEHFSATYDTIDGSDVAVGTRIYVSGNSGYAFEITQDNSTDEMTLTGWFHRTISYDVFDLSITLPKSFGENGGASHVDIALVACFESRTCGLCGVFDCNTINDFTYVDANGTLRNTDGSEYTTNAELISDVRVATTNMEIWTSVHEYGNKWIDEELVSIVQSDNENCENIPPPIDCTNFTYSACEIIECECIASDEIAFEQWLEICAFDSAALLDEDDCEELITILQETVIAQLFQTLMDLGIFDGPLTICEQMCPEEFQQPTFAVLSPSSIPSNIPSNKPSSNPSNTPSLEPSNKPSNEPTHRPTGYPTYKPTERPTGLPTPRPTTAMPTQQPAAGQDLSPCVIDNEMDVVFVIDLSHPIMDDDCDSMNTFLQLLVSWIVNEQYTRIGLVIYGNDGTWVLMHLDDYPIGLSNREQLILNYISNNINYCEDSMNDYNHYCEQGIEMGILEMVAYGNMGNDNVDKMIITIQHGACNAVFDLCESQYVTYMKNSNEIKSIVLNLGPFAINDENKCIVSETPTGSEIYINNFDSLGDFFTTFHDDLCPPQPTPGPTTSSSHGHTWWSDAWGKRRTYGGGPK